MSEGFLFPFGFWRLAFPISNKTLAAGAGSYSLTGTAASLRQNRTVVAASGSYALTGATATLRLGRRVIGAAGSYVLTGSGASLVYSGASPGSPARYWMGDPFIR